MQETIFVKLDESFLKSMDSRLSKRDMSLFRSESAIDMHAPLAMLVTNFSSSHEIDDDPEETDVLSFETKPKSGVIEYVPAFLKDYVQTSQGSL